jgi:hypothetical protein
MSMASQDVLHGLALECCNGAQLAGDGWIHEGSDDGSI